MQTTSQLYKEILQGPHWFENSVVIGDTSRLVDNDGGLILFGGDSILTDTGGKVTWDAVGGATSYIVFRKQGVFI